MMIRVLATLFTALLLLIAAAVVAGSVMFYRYGKDLPDIRQLATYEPAVTTRVYSGDGRLLAEYAAEKRVFVPIGSIPPRLIEAFLSAEDKNF
jgi:penicillin-binding protein 1A